MVREPARQPRFHVVVPRPHHSIGDHPRAASNARSTAACVITASPASACFANGRGRGDVHVGGSSFRPPPRQPCARVVAFGDASFERSVVVNQRSPQGSFASGPEPLVKSRCVCPPLHATWICPASSTCRRSPALVAP